MRLELKALVNDRDRLNERPERVQWRYAQLEPCISLMQGAAELIDAYEAGHITTEEFVATLDREFSKSAVLSALYYGHVAAEMLHATFNTDTASSQATIPISGI